MIFTQLKQQLDSLNQLLFLINDEQYSRKIVHLGNASIGGHTRHIIELLQCLMKGYELNEVDYFNRKRDVGIELNKSSALHTLKEIQNILFRPDKRMFLKEENFTSAINSSIETTFFREIIYNTEHAIHHLALIKVALVEMNLHIVNDEFGMAYSTIKYKESLSNT